MNMKRTLICLGLAAAFTTALAIDPRLSSISPAGVQVGKEVVLTFNGSRLDDAEEILFYKKGFEVVKLEATAANRVQATVKVAANCPLGEHPVRVRTKGGVTELSMTMDAIPHKFMARIAMPLIKGMVNKAVVADMDKLKTWCEQQASRRD